MTDSFAEDFFSTAEEIPVDSLATPALPTPADVLRLMAKREPPTATGFATLDEKTGGGLAPRNVAVIGGPPGSGKTSLVVQLATGLARQGSFVFIGLFHDEGRDQAAVRIGQQFGLPYAGLKEGGEAIASQLETALGECRIYLPDPDDSSVTIDSVFERIGAMPKPRLVVLDSIQSLFERSTDGKKDVRLAIKALMQKVRDLSTRHEVLTLVISQVHRGAYREKNESKNVTPLAAFSESGYIESAADIALVLSGSVDEGIKVTCPKSRLGPLFSFEMKFDRASCSFAEVPSTAEEDTEHDVRFRGEVSTAKEKIRKTLKSNPAISGREIYQFVRGRKKSFDAALDELQAAVEIIGEPGPRRAILWKLAVITPAGGVS